jgi:hypothetical protein
MAIGLVIYFVYGKRNAARVRGEANSSVTR